MSEEAKWWWRCAGAGLIVLLISLGFGMIPDIEACGGPGDIGSIIAFELVRSPSEVTALFGEEPCRSAFAAAMRQATWLDALAFIPAYSALLVFALLALRRYGPRIALAGIAATLLGAVADEIEGVLLFSIMDALPGGQGEIDWLVVMVRAKFALLGLATALAGWLLLVRRSGYGWIAGTIVGPGGLVTASILLGDRFAPAMVLGATVAWTALFATALLYAVAGRLRARPAG